MQRLVALATLDAFPARKAAAERQIRGGRGRVLGEHRDVRRAPLAWDGIDDAEDANRVSIVGRERHDRVCAHVWAELFALLGIVDDDRRAIVERAVADA